MMIGDTLFRSRDGGSHCPVCKGQVRGVVQRQLYMNCLACDEACNCNFVKAYLCIQKNYEQKQDDRFLQFINRGLSCNSFRSVALAALSKQRAGIKGASPNNISAKWQQLSSLTAVKLVIPWAYGIILFTAPAYDRASFPARTAEVQATEQDGCRGPMSAVPNLL
jgi:hypothetical protein